MASPQLDAFADYGLDAERALVRASVALGADGVAVVSDLERALIRKAVGTADEIPVLRRLIKAGLDPLGDAFCRLRDPAERRPMGATYTPPALVAMMTEWAAQFGQPARVVDPGLGSGRFLMAAARAFPKAQLVGIEVDPLAALAARANLSTAGFGNRAHVHLVDYRALELPTIDGPTLFIGNPPYVRHHLITPAWKEWLSTQAKSIGFESSQLAGLHVHFFLATAKLAKAGDFGAFITAAEWLDVNYGRLVRELLLGTLGGQSILVIEPTARPFPDAATTAAITTFHVGSSPKSIQLRRVDDLDEIGKIGTGVNIRRERLASETRWSGLSRAARAVPEGFVELGELCRVHRGQVTGSNRVWIAGPHSRDLPESVLFPTITKARELIRTDGPLIDAKALRRVIDLPVDLDEFDSSDRKAVARFLRWARKEGTHNGYVARNRRAWWAVGLREPPPILATYMARRPPVFVQNFAEARYINIAHGIYPRESFTALMLKRLTEHLMKTAPFARGRTYAGGLMKFEPREMERLIVPGPSLLRAAIA